MQLSRRRAIQINRVLDNGFPPWLRDNRYLCGLLMRLVFREEWRMVMDFKLQVPRMTDDEFADAYRRINRFLVHQDTDLNDASIERIRELVVGDVIADVGCGRGELLETLRGPRRRLTGFDVDITTSRARLGDDVELFEGFAERLPFEDERFDTVISTHTLEHVRDLREAIAELRRTARRRVVVVVPMQRPYRYTFNLHIHFFPYPESLELAMAPPPGTEHSCEIVDGDLLYWEDVPR